MHRSKRIKGATPRRHSRRGCSRGSLGVGRTSNASSFPQHTLSAALGVFIWRMSSTGVVGKKGGAKKKKRTVKVTKAAVAASTGSFHSPHKFPM